MRDQVDIVLDSPGMYNSLWNPYQWTNNRIIPVIPNEVWFLNLQPWSVSGKEIFITDDTESWMHCVLLSVSAVHMCHGCSWEKGPLLSWVTYEMSLLPNLHHQTSLWNVYEKNTATCLQAKQKNPLPCGYIQLSWSFFKGESNMCVYG